MDTVPLPPQTAGIGQPTWEIAHLFPYQGEWSEQEYLNLNTNHLIEFSDGCLEVLPMPTMAHQLIVLWLCDRLREFVVPQDLGRVLVSPFRIRLAKRRYREPDIMFMLARHASRMQNQFWEGADLVMEVVSSDNPDRDLLTKRLEYAEAGIPEYWIVDPQQSLITVLRLTGAVYAVHGQFTPGQQATSVLLSGFKVDVSAVFASAE